jgi:hypothetical protein
MSPDSSLNDEEHDPPETPRNAAGKYSSNTEPLGDSEVIPGMANADEETQDGFSRETDEWNQARQDAAAALQRAMDRRGGAAVPVDLPYTLNEHL